MKSLTLNSAALGLLVSGALLCTNVYATGNAASFDDASWNKKVDGFTQMTNKTFEYEVSGYKIRLRFDDENTISWERLEAPDGTAGQTGTQTIDRMNVHPGIFVMAWTEADGSHVVDIVDTQRMQLYANFVMPDGQRFQTKARLTEVN